MEIIIFIFGLCIGSFLNVCISRMPHEGYSIIKPPSHCPNCKKTILWHDNIPLISFILLRGSCRFCRGKISWQYPIVEILTAVIFLFFYKYYGLNPDFFFYLIFACGLVISTFIDIKWRIIPDEISLGGIFAGLLFGLIKGRLIDSILGALAGGALVYASGLLGNLLFFRLMKKESIEGETESIGGGDVKLLAMIGSFLGWKLAVLTFFTAPFFGALAGIFVLIFKKSHLIPYGPFLSLAALISLFFGNQIINLLLFR